MSNTKYETIVVILVFCFFIAFSFMISHLFSHFYTSILTPFFLILSLFILIRIFYYEENTVESSEISFEGLKTMNFTHGLIVENFRNFCFVLFMFWILTYLPVLPSTAYYSSLNPAEYNSLLFILKYSVSYSFSVVVVLLISNYIVSYNSNIHIDSDNNVKFSINGEKKRVSIEDMDNIQVQRIMFFIPRVRIEYLDESYVFYTKNPEKVRDAIVAHKI